MFSSITYFSDNQCIPHLRVGKFTDPQTVKSLIVNALGDARVFAPPLRYTRKDFLHEIMQIPEKGFRKASSC